MKQRTQEWFDARVGKVTASRVKDVMAKGKRDNKPLKAREDYLAELVAERLSGQTFEHYVNAAMQWGIDTEPEARTTYELIKDEPVELVGFVQHPMISMAGASPDGLVGSQGLVEIKCPTTATHIKYLKAQEIPDDYTMQMIWQMICTGRTWCDFMSYDPRLPDPYRVFLKRLVLPTDDFVRAIESEVILFDKEVDGTIKKIKEAVSGHPRNAKA